MKTVRLYLVLFFLKMGVGYTQTPTIKPIFNDFDSPHFLFEKFTIGNKKVSKLEKVYSNGELLYSIKSTFKFDLKGRIVNKIVEDKEKIVKSKFTYFENDLWKTRTKKTNYKEVILNLDDSVVRSLVTYNSGKLKEINCSWDYSVKFSYNSDSLIDTIYYDDDMVSSYSYDDKNRVISNHQYNPNSNKYIFSYEYEKNRILSKHKVIRKINGINDTISTSTNIETYYNSDTLKTKQISTYLDYNSELKKDTLLFSYRNKKLVKSSEKISKNDFSEITYFVYDEFGNLVNKKKVNSKTKEILSEAFYEYVSF